MGYFVTGLALFRALKTVLEAPFDGIGLIRVTLLQSSVTAPRFQNTARVIC